MGIVGKYGAHSDASREAKVIYDAGARVEHPKGVPHLWLCGHFSGKSFALLLKLLRKDQQRPKDFLFWQTKSAVQPLGPKDEWSRLAEDCRKNRKLREWAVVGGRCGTGHPSAMVEGTSKGDSERP